MGEGGGKRVNLSLTKEKGGMMYKEAEVKREMNKDRLLS